MRVENKEIECLYLKNQATLAKKRKECPLWNSFASYAPNFTDIRRMFRFCD